jgi:hypothetical protein
MGNFSTVRIVYIRSRRSDVVNTSTSPRGLSQTTINFSGETGTPFLVPAFDAAAFEARAKNSFLPSACRTARPVRVLGHGTLRVRFSALPSTSAKI